MRVLLVNKFLYGGAGAETVMFRTAELLRSSGHGVIYFAMQDPRNVECAESRYFPRGRYYDQSRPPLSRALDAAASIYSLDARKSLRRLLRDQRPDIAHLHNVYHQLTLSVVDELAAQGIPTVMTLHDYKPVCPSYVLYTDGAPCHRCVASHPGHAVVHRCIKGSRAASVVAATETLIERRLKLYGKIDAFISPSKHLADVMVQGGIPAERLHVIPNFVADEQFGTPATRAVTALDARPMALYVGRLEEVKGVRVLLAAAKQLAPEVEVAVVGHGALEPEVREAHALGLVNFYGQANWHEIARLMDAASTLVVPSIWEENCPMVVLEAGARGCPVVASDRGGLRELVHHQEDGMLFAPDDPDDLARTLRELTRDPQMVARFGEARRERTLTQYTSAAYLTSLLDLYARIGELHRV